MKYQKSADSELTLNELYKINKHINPKNKNISRTKFSANQHAEFLTRGNTPAKIFKKNVFRSLLCESNKFQFTEVKWSCDDSETNIKAKKGKSILFNFKNLKPNTCGLDGITKRFLSCLPAMYQNLITIFVNSCMADK